MTSCDTADDAAPDPDGDTAEHTTVNAGCAAGDGQASP